MKPADEVWLEIVKGQLAAGDSAVIAVSKANVVATAYHERFGAQPICATNPTIHLESAEFQNQEYEVDPLSIPSPDYIGESELRS